MNLLSIHKFCLHNNCSCHFDANELKIQDIPTGRLLYKGLSENGVYPIYSKNFLKPTAFQSASVPQSSQSAQLSYFPFALHVNRVNKWLMWHHRLGHPSNKVLTITLSSVDASCILPINDSITHCKHCLNGKMHQLTFDKYDFKASNHLNLFTLMFGVQHPLPLSMIFSIMFYLLMITPNLPSFFF